MYYVSHILQDAKTRYTNLEKLAFALLIAARKLRPYFQSHLIIVSTSYLLRKALNRLDSSGRFAKWALELRVFGVNYVPRPTIKVQAPADFIAEFTRSTAVTSSG